MWIAILIVGLSNGAIPVEVMALAPIFTLLGGGDCVFISTVSAAITDIAPDEQVRATLFAYTSSVAYVSTLCAPALAAFTMTQHLWLPFYIGLTLLLLALPLALILPKRSGDKAKDSPANGSEQAPLLENEHVVATFDRQEQPRDRLKHSRQHVRDLIHSIKSRPKFQLLLGVFFLASLASSNTPILVLYISKRYHWTFAQAGYLLSAKAAVNVFLLTVLVPFLVHAALHRFNLSSRSVHIGAAEISIFISVLGALVVAASPATPGLIAGT